MATATFLALSKQFHSKVRQDVGSVPQAVGHRAWAQFPDTNNSTFLQPQQLQLLHDLTAGCRSLPSTNQAAYTAVLPYFGRRSQHGKRFTSITCRYSELHVSCFTYVTTASVFQSLSSSQQVRLNDRPTNDRTDHLITLRLLGCNTYSILPTFLSHCGRPQVRYPKGKAISVTGRGGVWVYEMLRISHWLANRLTDGG
jgi:hypothetical protein